MQTRQRSLLSPRGYAVAPSFLQVSLSSVALLSNLVTPLLNGGVTATNVHPEPIFHMMPAERGLSRECTANFLSVCQEAPPASSSFVAGWLIRKDIDAIKAQQAENIFS
jgi:hypothetical protein